MGKDCNVHFNTKRFYIKNFNAIFLTKLNKGFTKDLRVYSVCHTKTIKTKNLIKNLMKYLMKEFDAYSRFFKILSNFGNIL